MGCALASAAATPRSGPVRSTLLCCCAVVTSDAIGRDDMVWSPRVAFVDACALVVVGSSLLNSLYICGKLGILL